MAKPKTILVKAGVNGPVLRPKLSHKSRGKWINVITDEPVLVPNTRYYQRRIMKRDLVLVEVTTKSPPKEKETYTKKEQG